MTLVPIPHLYTYTANNKYACVLLLQTTRGLLLKSLFCFFIRVLLHRRPGCSSLPPSLPACSHSHLLHLPPLDSNASNAGRLAAVGLSAKDTDSKRLWFHTTTTPGDITETALCVRYVDKGMQLTLKSCWRVSDTENVCIGLKPLKISPENNGNATC